MKSITFDDFSRKTYAKMKIVACKYMDSDCKGSDQGGNNYFNNYTRLCDLRAFKTDCRKLRIARDKPFIKKNNQRILTVERN